MRSLLGGAKEKLVHDPGAEGPEGEGEAAMTMMVIVYAIALGLIIYEKFIKKDKDHDALAAEELADIQEFKAKLEAQKTENADGTQCAVGPEQNVYGRFLPDVQGPPSDQGHLGPHKRVQNPER